VNIWKWALLLLAVPATPVEAAAPPTLPPEARFAALTNDETWKRLPWEAPPLPAWARTLATSLPRAAVGMLELDYVHRARSPLGPVLRGKLRWVAADANRCAYAKRYAEADLRRAGLTDKDLRALAGDHRACPPAERAALAFARKLTRAAHTVTDAEMADLLAHYGPDKVVAIVHTLAYANFQDRILLALAAEVEPGGPLPPVEIRLDRAARAAGALPPRWPWAGLRTGKASRSDARPDWLGQSFNDLQKALDRQKSRKGRIPPPPPDRLAKLPPEMRKRIGRIVWSQVSLGYQPVLTKAWFDCMSAFQEEAKMDRVLGNSMFWVITRSNECFY
jgi:alkylhydroperoxidase family enzyme